MRLSGKTAIVTGGAGSLGSAIARRFTEAGASVVMVDIVPEDGATRARELKDSGANAMYINADIADASEWARIVEETLAAYGKIDVLVNNAGLSSMIGDDRFALDIWDRLISVNLTAPFLAIREVLPVMQKAGSGSIVNVCSVGALVALDPGHVGYTASKAGLAGLTRVIADRFGSDGIRANNIYPGAMPPMRKPEGIEKAVATSTEDSRARAVGITPLEKLGTADDIAWAALYFASEESTYVTGADLRVDGGIAIR